MMFASEGRRERSAKIREMIGAERNRTAACNRRWKRRIFQFEAAVPIEKSRFGKTIAVVLKALKYQQFTGRFPQSDFDEGI
jgi:hypothetical protein